MCCFRKKPFETLMADTPHVAHRLLEMTLDELDGAREWRLVRGRTTGRQGSPRGPGGPLRGWLPLSVVSKEPCLGGVSPV